MCNPYSITTNQPSCDHRAFPRRQLVNRYVGNLALMPGVFPDYPAPVIRNTGEPVPSIYEIFLIRVQASTPNVALT